MHESKIRHKSQISYPKSFKVQQPLLLAKRVWDPLELAIRLCDLSVLGTELSARDLWDQPSSLISFLNFAPCKTYLRFLLTHKELKMTRFAPLSPPKLEEKEARHGHGGLHMQSQVSLGNRVSSVLRKQSRKHRVITRPRSRVRCLSGCCSPVRLGQMHLSFSCPA